MSRVFSLVTVLSLALVAASCHEHHRDHNAQNGNQNGNNGAGTTQNSGVTQSSTDFRGACADDMQKYCANDPRKRPCLRDNIDRLGDACKSALNASGGYGNFGNGDNGGNGGNYGNSGRPRIGRICADDIQKFCANDDRKFRCLRNNLDQLGDACKAALNAARGQNGHRGGWQNGNQ